MTYSFPKSLSLILLSFFFSLFLENIFNLGVNGILPAFLVLLIFLFVGYKALPKFGIYLELDDGLFWSHYRKHDIIFGLLLVLSSGIYLYSKLTDGTLESFLLSLGAMITISIFSLILFYDYGK